MPPLDPTLCADVVQLAQQGMKWRAIARALKISRNTVRRIVTEHQQAREQPHSALPASRRLARASKLDPLRPRVEELLRVYPDITAQRVFEVLREKESYGGGYTIVKELVRRIRPKPAAKPSLETVGVKIDVA